MRLFTSVYLFLLAYIIVALVFWEVRLQKQNEELYGVQLINLRSNVDSATRSIQFNTDKKKLEHGFNARTSQYKGEGITFLLIIMVGAFVVYRSILHRIRMSRQQNNFMLSVTHELKSPIAAIKLNLQTLEKYRLDDEKRQLLAQRSIKEADRLNSLCNNILLASQLEGRQYKPAKEQFDFSELVMQTVRDYNSRYPGRFSVTVKPELAVSGDSVMLVMALSNLLENAVKYSPADDQITVDLFQKGPKVVLQVADHGPGIPDSEKRNVFNKFYRLGNEESRKTKGTGLGLYLTNKIALQHKGTIVVKDNEPQGCIFELELPG